MKGKFDKSDFYNEFEQEILIDEIFYNYNDDCLLRLSFNKYNIDGEIIEEFMIQVEDSMTDEITVNAFTHEEMNEFVNFINKYLKNNKMEDGN